MTSRIWRQKLEKIAIPNILSCFKKAGCMDAQSEVCFVVTTKQGVKSKRIRDFITKN